MWLIYLILYCFLVFESLVLFGFFMELLSDFLTLLITLSIHLIHLWKQDRATASKTKQLHEVGGIIDSSLSPSLNQELIFLLLENIQRQLADEIEISG